MLTLSPTMLAAIALFCGAWLALGLWAVSRGLGRARAADERVESTRHHEALLAASPAMPLIVHRGGGLEEAERIAQALALEEVPARLEQLRGAFGGDDMEALEAQVAASAAAAGSFALSLRPVGSSRVYRVRGGPAPPSYPAGTILLWLSDGPPASPPLSTLCPA
jgi:hypothetical protein